MAELSWGDKLKPLGLRTDAGVTRQQFQPTEAGAADDDASAIVFTLKPKKALAFTPKKLSFNASRVGTNGGAFDVVVVSGGQATKVGEKITPQLAKEAPYVSAHEFDLSSIPATDDIFYVKSIFTTWPPISSMPSVTSSLLAMWLALWSQYPATP